MKKVVQNVPLFLLLLIVAFGLAACATKNQAAPIASVTENFYKSGASDKDLIELTKINDVIWMHTSYTSYNGSRASANGVIAISSEGIVLVDTPWNSTQTLTLLKLVRETFGKDIVLAIVTHAHADNIGGINTLLENGVEVRSTQMTVNQAEKNGFSKPEPDLDSEPAFTIGDLEIETYYPGAGHAPDNITVWFPQHKVLFGGCLIKSLEAKDKGSITDADLQQWPASVQKVKEKYPDAEVVVPGHGPWGNTDLLKYTLELVGEE